MLREVAAATRDTPSMDWNGVRRRSLRLYQPPWPSSWRSSSNGGWQSEPEITASAALRPTPLLAAAAAACVPDPTSPPPAPLLCTWAGE